MKQFALGAPLALALALAILLANLALGDDDMCTPTRVLTAPKYSYSTSSSDGPSSWGGSCTSGKIQSPIDVVQGGSEMESSGYRPTASNSVFKYKAGNRNFAWVCVRRYGGCGGVDINGSLYDLVQMHLHSSSEHSLNGVRYGLELHMVYKHTGTEKLAVAGVMFRIGRRNIALSKLLNAAETRRYAVMDDLDTLLLAGQAGITTCTWNGSLTTPPCTEGVTWMMSMRTLQASLEQVGRYRTMLGELGNARAIQPRNGRQIKCYRNPQLETDAVLPGIVRSVTDVDNGVEVGVEEALVF